MADLDKRAKRSAAAKKGWETRKKNMSPQARRSAAAKKGWETRRRKMSPQERRQRAAKKGWETRRRKTPEFQRRSQAAKKGWEKRRVADRAFAVLQQVREEIENWEPEASWSNTLTANKEQDVTTVRSLLEGAIERDGEKAVAMRLENNAEHVLSAIATVLYDSNQERVDSAVAAFANVINERALTAEESADLEDLLEDLLWFSEQ